MRILLINKFLYGRGGAEHSTLTTGRLLEARGHEVIYWGMAHPQNPSYPHEDCFTPHVDYDDLPGLRPKIRAAVDILWSRRARRQMQRLLKRVRPDVVHMNNIAHQLSPSFLPVLKRYGIPLVMTLRDYKLVCPSYAMLSRDGLCDRCAGGRYYHCLLRRCTKGSCAKSLVNTLEMYFHHRWMGVYDLIDEFISPSRFLAARVKAMGFARRVHWLPNFVEVDRLEPGYESDGRTLVYFGRLSREKGLLTLLDAIRGLDVRLRIVGDGPLRGELESRVRSGHLRNVCLPGHHSGPALHEIIRSATAVVLPSEWYENNPRCLLEGFALGKGAIASRIGGIGELVTPGHTGWLFDAGNVRALRTAIENMWKNPDKAARMGRNARAYVERFHGPDRHYRRLLAIYRAAGRRGPSATSQEPMIAPT